MIKNLKSKIEKRFNNIKFKKIILYKNPNEFTSLYIERINPNHVGIIWGRRNKKYNKGTHYIQCGKVFFKLSWIPVIYGASVIGWLDAFTNYVYNLILTLGVSSLIVATMVAILFYKLPIYLSEVEIYVISDT